MDVIIAARLSQKIKGRGESGIQSQDEDAREWAKEHESGKRWIDTTLGRILRNPATAGRRMDNYYADESQRKTILQHEGVITWAEHEQLCARLSSRAHRKGISSYNVTLLTGILVCVNGHPMYRARSRNRVDQYYCRRCGISAPMAEIDALASDDIQRLFGSKKQRVPRIIPASNHFEEIARLRQDRSELDDLADDYAERHAAITAEIRRLAREDQDNPQQDQIKWVDSEQTIAEDWLSLDTPKRHDWLVNGKWKITAIKVADKWTLMFKPGIQIISDPVPMEALSFPSDSPFYLTWNTNTM